MRKLKEMILEEGYTSNNLIVKSIVDITPTDNDIDDTVYKVQLYSKKDREYLEFIIETE